MRMRSGRRGMCAQANPGAVFSWPDSLMPHSPNTFTVSHSNLAHYGGPAWTAPGHLGIACIDAACKAAAPTRTKGPAPGGTPHAQGSASCSGADAAHRPAKHACEEANISYEQRVHAFRCLWCCTVTPCAWPVARCNPGCVDEALLPGCASCAPAACTATAAGLLRCVDVGVQRPLGDARV